MGLIILTKSPKFNLFSKENIKNIGRIILKKTRGPQAVIGSLLSGLNDLDYEYKFNPKIKNIGTNDTIYVTSSIEALKLAINLKRTKKIKKLIAGPTLVVTPDDYGGIIKDKNIDVYLVPSEWTKNFYTSFGSVNFTQKIKIWAAGVDLPAKLTTKKILCLVYKKNIGNSMFKMVVKELEKKNIETKIIYYGKYKKEDYFDLLEKSIFMIYLQESESQGIALLEAWARNVPTLVYNNGSYTFKKINKTVYGNVSAPYLTDECGLFFKENNFNERLNCFINNLNNFQPRAYIEKNFTNKICAQNFLNIINI